MKQRLRVPFGGGGGGGVAAHWRRWRTYEYRSSCVLEQVLQERYLDGSPATTNTTAVIVVVVVVIVVVVAVVVVVVVVDGGARRWWCRWRRRLLLLRRHRALARRTVRQIVRYELLRFRVHVRRPPDADPVVGRRPVPSIATAAATTRFVVPAAHLLGRRRRSSRSGRRQVLVPFQYGLRSPVWFRRTVYRLGRNRWRRLAAFPWKKRRKNRKTGTVT